jgi:soluble lytic murein transglycosylase-like protein
MMKVSNSTKVNNDYATFPSAHRDSHKRKATLRVAFRLFPVFLAFLVSSLVITFLLNIQPAGAASEEKLSRNTNQSIQTEHIPYSSPSTDRMISPAFTKEVLYWEDQIIAWAKTYHLDPNLVAVVMQIESCGHPSIGSHAGAQGLFQVMPFHFSPDENPIDPYTNAHRGLSYLAQSLELAKDNPSLALAGYNGGHSVIMLNPDSWFDETKRYVYWGSGILSDISQGHTQSARLNEWLNAGGQSLCDRSSEALGL